MLSETGKRFTKENLNTYLKELAKEFRKTSGKNAKAEIVLVGGAAVLANYSFRDGTMDIDAAIHAPSSIKDAIIRVSDKFNFPNDWINTDFMRTKSYSHKVDEYSTYYREFSNVLTVRTIKAEYLIAMKLVSNRTYKNDNSDIIGILKEQSEIGKPITKDMIKDAVIQMYGDYDILSDESKAIIENISENDDLDDKYNKTRRNEIKNKELLQTFEEDYPDVLNEINIADILKTLEKQIQEEDEFVKQLNSISDDSFNLNQ